MTVISSRPTTKLVGLRKPTPTLFFLHDQFFSGCQLCPIFVAQCVSPDKGENPPRTSILGGPLMLLRGWNCRTKRAFFFVELMCLFRAKCNLSSLTIASRFSEGDIALPIEFAGCSRLRFEPLSLPGIYFGESNWYFTAPS